MAMRQWLVQTVTPILCGLIFLLGVVILGRAAHASLRDAQAYTMDFSAIACRSPGGLSRQQFLTEVRNLSQQVAPFNLLDRDLNANFQRAFASHPWVEAVRGVQIERSRVTDGPSRARLRLDLVFRQPVLALCPLGHKPPQGTAEVIEICSYRSGSADIPIRVVDRNGILLSARAVDSRLPVLCTSSCVTEASMDGNCGNPDITAAATTIAFLQPHLSRLGLDACEVELLEGEIVLRAPGVRIVWGHSPGAEQEFEARAEEKLRRLLDYQSCHNGLQCLEHDVRLLAFQGHFPLSARANP
jgi:hypothetical protein